MTKLNRKKFNTAYPDKVIDWRENVYATSDRLIYKPSMLFGCLWLVAVTMLCVCLLPFMLFKFDFRLIAELYHLEQREELFEVENINSLCSGRCVYEN